MGSAPGQHQCPCSTRDRDTHGAAAPTLTLHTPPPSSLSPARPAAPSPSGGRQAPPGPWGGWGVRGQDAMAGGTPTTPALAMC